LTDQEFGAILKPNARDLRRAHLEFLVNPPGLEDLLGLSLGSAENLQDLGGRDVGRTTVALQPQNLLGIYFDCERDHAGYWLMFKAYGL
jgi:hypothetical protein